MEHSPASGSQSATHAAEPHLSGAEVDLTGKTLGDFAILRRLGQGGMGQVYLAEQISLKRQVALKLLRPDLANNSVSLQRFKREAEAIARATHSSIVQVYAIGETDGIHYMALEYIEGRNLREFLEKKGSPEILIGLGIMHQVASALQRASELGIIHRDIKPENILINRKGEVKVADFGLFRDPQSESVSITQSGITMGTPLYMSPEQVEGKDLDSRSDIYSFGVTCYHMFAGQPPFKGNSPYEVALQHVNKEAKPLQDVRPDLPAELCSLIHRMLAKQPEKRPQTGREIVREVVRLRDQLVGLTSSGSGASAFNLGPALRDSTDAMSTQSLPHFAQPPRNAGPWLGIAAIATALGLGLGGAFLLWGNKSAATVADPDAEVLVLPKAGPPLKELEKEWLRDVQRYANPSNLQAEMAGLNASIELGVLYLKDRRLDEAEKFFSNLARADQPIKNYQMLGQLGNAMTYAFRDQYEKSNRIFQNILEREKGDKGGNVNHFWYNNPPLREMIAKALTHNLINSPENFPRRLDKWLIPPMGPTRKQ